jgi:hypothetical protein
MGASHFGKKHFFFECELKISHYKCKTEISSLHRGKVRAVRTLDREVLPPKMFFFLPSFRYAQDKSFYPLPKPYSLIAFFLMTGGLMTHTIAGTAKHD